MQKMIMMHKNVPAAVFFINRDSGRIIGELEILNEEHLPIPVIYARDRVGKLADWIHGRSIPRSREDLDELLAIYRVQTPEALSFKNLGLNLSDSYWFQPAEAELSWEDVNLFDNDFEQLRFINPNDSYSPDASSNGALPKYWSISENNERLLYKAGSKPFRQEPYNEHFASKVLDVLEIPHTEYHVEFIDELPYSVCRTFSSPSVEYIPALDFIDVRKQRNNEGKLEHLLKCAEAVGASVGESSFDTMLSFDYLINNTDRHYGNFGFLRNPDTLEFSGIAPIFDNGNSLWYRSIAREINFRDFQSKPFRHNHNDQIKLVKSIPLDLARLTDDVLDDIAVRTFKTMNDLEPQRIKKIMQHVKMSRDYLISLQKKKMQFKTLR